MYLYIDDTLSETLLETIKEKPGLENLRKQLERNQKEEDQTYVEEARKHYEEKGFIEIDDNAVVSKGDDGAYVMAWVYVSKP